MSDSNGHGPSDKQRPPVEFADWIYEDIELLRPDFPDDGVPECSPHGRLRALDRDNYECYVLMRELLMQFLRNEIDATTYGQRHHDLHELSAAITKSHRARAAAPGVAHEVTVTPPRGRISYTFGVMTRGRSAAVCGNPATARFSLPEQRERVHSAMASMQYLTSRCLATLTIRSSLDRSSGDPPVDHVPGALSTSRAVL